MKIQLHGRGFDPVVMIRDLNMLEWINANCYRTSHYPYNEIRGYEADRRGIATIVEVPAVGILYVFKILYFKTVQKRSYYNFKINKYHKFSAPITTIRENCIIR